MDKYNQPTIKVNGKNINEYAYISANFALANEMAEFNSTAIILLKELKTNNIYTKLTFWFATILGTIALLVTIFK